MLRLPHEMLRKTFKTSQKHFEREQTQAMSALGDAAAAAAAATPEESLRALDGVIARMQGYKRKVEVLREEETVLHGHVGKRIAHLQDLYDVSSLDDAGYDRWSRVRLDRLMVDFLLRTGCGATAAALARDKAIEALVDVDVFMGCRRIEQALRAESTAECLAWCQENKLALRKQKVRLRIGKLLGALELTGPTEQA